MGKAIKKVTKDPLRSLAAVGTLGASEQFRAGGKLLGINLEGEEGAYHEPDLTATEAYNKYAQGFDKEMLGAEKGVQESALTKGLYGKGGLNERLGTEEQKLASQGFQLTPEDREAYGQASGDVSRLFGQQEQQASQSLARRGLASANSGAAGATFSGLAGNKNEMLARAQTDIAQKRMADTQNRLMQTRNMMQSMGTQGSQLAQQRYNSKGDSLFNNANAANAASNLQRQALADKEAAYKPGLFESIGQGLQTGMVNLATAAPGMAVGGMTGGASMAGGGMAAPMGASAGQLQLANSSRRAGGMR